MIVLAFAKYQYVDPSFLYTLLRKITKCTNEWLAISVVSGSFFSSEENVIIVDCGGRALGSNLMRLAYGNSDRGGKCSD